MTPKADPMNNDKPEANKALEPCPWCGGQVTQTYMGSSDWCFECQKCAKSVSFYVNAKKFGYGTGETAEAARRWNTRTPPAPVTLDKIEGLEEAIKETEYKYFGDYEFSENQWKAVDIIVKAARAYLAASRRG